MKQESLCSLKNDVAVFAVGMSKSYSGEEC